MLIKNKFNNKAFTLIELLVAILIIVLMLLGINTISIIKISEAQKIGIFKNNIKNNIETALNNSLSGKAVNNSLLVPKYRKIEIKDNYNGSGYGTGQIIISYGDTSFSKHEGLSIKSKLFYSIDSIYCQNLDGTNKSKVSRVTLLIKNGNISINGCPDNQQKMISFDVSYKNHKKKIYISSINNVINSD